MNPDRTKIFQHALKLLAIRARSKKELLDLLCKKHSNIQLIKQVLEELEKTKLLDDQEFTRWYVESRSRSRPRSAWLLKKELQKFGIDSQTVEVYISESDQDLAQSALDAKIARFSKLNWPDFQIKASRFLHSRGFSWPTIEKILKKSYNKLHVIKQD